MNPTYSLNADVVKSEIRKALINQKVNACPMACRVAWHSAGTFDAADGTGGSNGATMRFAPEDTDPANAGLSIIRDLLHEVKLKFPQISHADLWTLAGAAAIEFQGGPKIPYALGRTDAPNGSFCPPNGRLPDASQGAQHLRDVFYRMGMNDREIVVLSGGHTLGRCHLTRSGYDGKWTDSPLKFDNSYFKNLIEREWKPRDWDGKLQYTDVETKELMMLPTDIALINDPIFRPYVEAYAKDEALFFQDFAAAYGKLLSLGTPSACPHLAKKQKSGDDFREACMHGHDEEVHKLGKSGTVDVQGVEGHSGRTALHKAAFWGHTHLIEFLVKECCIDPNVRDYNGDTALHDAARFGHEGVAEILIPVTDVHLKNNAGQDVLAVAIEYSKDGGGNLPAKLRLIEKLSKGNPEFRARVAKM